MEPIRGITTKRLNGLLTIRTETGIDMTIKNDSIPLFVSVLVYFDYTRNCIREVTTDIPHPDTEDHHFLESDEEIEELPLTEDSCLDEEQISLYHDPDLNEIPEASEDWD